MNRGSTFIVMLSLALLAGCGSSTAPTAPVTYPNLTGNWQIQSAIMSTADPAGQVVLFGALQNSTSSTAVTGTFRFTNLLQPQSCGLNQVVTLNGTVDSSGDLNLISAPFAGGSLVKIQLGKQSAATGFSTGTVEVDGTACGLVSSPALGVQIAPVNGTFGGSLTAGPDVTSTVVAGSASLVLAQSSTPSADGQFPLTGMLTYTLGTCSGTAALSGDASGVGVTLSTAAPPLGVPTVTFFGAVDPTADQIQTASLQIESFACTGTQPSEHFYTAKLSRQ